MDGPESPVSQRQANVLYTQDLSYPSRFLFGLTPVQMRWAAASAPGNPLTGSFNYCDLGCGDGVTLNLLASEFPESIFYGVDFNAEHIEQARGLAARAGLENASFMHADFSRLQNEALPPMDYIAVHGVYSWIGPKLRECIHAFLESHLKPGGLVCVQYSTLPGSIVQDALFHYLRQFASIAEGNSGQRLTEALVNLRRLAPLSRFFDNNPQGAELFEQALRNPIGFVAHDVLNRDEHSRYFGEISQTMSSLGLDYMGSSNLKLNYPEIVMTSSAFELYSEITADADLHLREETKDLMINTVARCDVFRRPNSDTDVTASDSSLVGVEGLYLHRMAGSNDLDARRRASQTCAVDLASPVHSAILDAAETPNATVADIVNSTTAQGHDRSAVERGIGQLYMMRFLNVLVRPAADATPEPGARYRLTGSLNPMLLAENMSSPETVAFAAPVLGTALTIPLPARVRLAAFLGHDVESLWQALQVPDVTGIEYEGRQIESAAQLHQLLDSLMPAFLANAVPQLLRYGLLEKES